VILAAEVAAPLPHGDALALLLSAEGFVLAAVAVAVTLGAPNQPRQAKHKAFTADRIMNWAVGLLAVLAVGALSAWIGLARDGSFESWPDKVVGAVLIVASVGMPVTAWSLVLGSRRA
jgi:hypothetical protein